MCQQDEEKRKTEQRGSCRSQDGTAPQAFDEAGALKGPQYARLPDEKKAAHAQGRTVG